MNYKTWHDAECGLTVLPETHPVLNETVVYDPTVDLHPWTTFHTYGMQVHDTRAEAERWNAAQKEIRPARKDR